MKKVPPELNRIVDKVLAYRPKQSPKKKKGKQSKKTTGS
jgi:hypothetical protein